VPDVAFLLAHRKELLGGPVSAWLQRLLRGPSEDWSVGERELFAAMTARQNACPF